METTCACCGENLLVHLPLPEFVQCDRCREEWEEVSRQDIAFDLAADKASDERFARMVNLLRECYPTTIPDWWLR